MYNMYNRINFSKVIDFNKTNESKEYNICHYCYLNKDFNFQYYIFIDV